MGGMGRPFRLSLLGARGMRRTFDMLKKGPRPPETAFVRLLFLFQMPCFEKQQQHATPPPSQPSLLVFFKKPRRRNNLYRTIPPYWPAPAFGLFTQIESPWAER